MKTLVFFFSKKKRQSTPCSGYVSVLSYSRVVGWIRIVESTNDAQTCLDCVKPRKGETLLNAVEIEP